MKTQFNYHKFDYQKFASITNRNTHSLKEGVVAYTIPSDGFDKLIGYAVNGVMIWIHTSFRR